MVAAAIPVTTVVVQDRICHRSLETATLTVARAVVATVVVVAAGIMVVALVRHCLLLGLVAEEAADLIFPAGLRKYRPVLAGQAAVGPEPKLVVRLALAVESAAALVEVAEEYILLPRFLRTVSRLLRNPVPLPS